MRRCAWWGGGRSGRIAGSAIRSGFADVGNRGGSGEDRPERSRGAEAHGGTANRRRRSDARRSALHGRLGHSAKVSSLSDLEYRVWTTYVLATDDFGVMRADAVAFQTAHDALSTRPAHEIAKCVEGLVETGLVAAFEQQGARYLYQCAGRTSAPAVLCTDAAPVAGLGRGQREDAPPVVRPSGRHPGAGPSAELRHYSRRTSVSRTRVRNG